MQKLVLNKVWYYEERGILSKKYAKQMFVNREYPLPNSLVWSKHNSSK